MKKTLFLSVLMALTMSVNAQWFDLSNNVGRLSLGVNLGEVGLNCPYHAFGFGISLSAYGGYIDFVYSGPEHQFDNHVNAAQYNDSAALAINLGYMIPVLPWLRVMPLVGYCQTNAGITDASTVNVEVNENSASVYHDYTVTPGTRNHRFNFGGGVEIRPIKWINIYGVYTYHAIYGGISLNLDAFSN